MLHECAQADRIFQISKKRKRVSISCVFEGLLWVGCAQHAAGPQIDYTFLQLVRAANSLRARRSFVGVFYRSIWVSIAMHCHRLVLAHVSDRHQSTSIEVNFSYGNKSRTQGWFNLCFACERHSKKSTTQKDLKI